MEFNVESAGSRLNFDFHMNNYVCIQLDMSVGQTTDHMGNTRFRLTSLWFDQNNSFLFLHLFGNAEEFRTISDGSRGGSNRVHREEFESTVNIDRN